MDKNKAKGYIGIANKAGYLIIGGDNLKDYRQKLYLVLVDNQSGKSTVKIAQKLQQLVPVVFVDNLGQLLDKPTTKIVGIKNKALSQLIQQSLNQ